MSKLICVVLLLFIACAPVPVMRLDGRPESNCITGVELVVEIKCIQDFQDTDTVKAVQVCYENRHTAVKRVDGIVMLWPTAIYRVKIIGGN